MAKPSKTKTARFTDVVKTCGKPEPVYLWTRPQEDRQFMAAVKQNRVMTIKQETVGTTRDFGLVGFIEEKNASYFVFPRPLDAFQDPRIVGIKYELVKAAAPVGRVVKEQARPPRVPRPPRPEIPRSARFDREAQHREALSEPAVTPLPVRGAPAEPAPTARRFKVTYRFTAVTDLTQEVEAGSKKEAQAKADRLVRTPDFSGATITRKALRVVEVGA